MGEGARIGHGRSLTDTDHVSYLLKGSGCLVNFTAGCKYFLVCPMCATLLILKAGLSWICVNADNGIGCSRQACSWRQILAPAVRAFSSGNELGMVLSIVLWLVSRLVCVFIWIWTRHGQNMIYGPIPNCRLICIFNAWFFIVRRTI